jgi:hypothetical protein
MIRKSVKIGEGSIEAIRGAVLCRDLSVERGGQTTTFRRGTTVDDALIATLNTRAGTSLEVVVAEPGELSQGEASLRAAQALAGSGVQVAPPHQGQCVLRAAQNGLLRVDQMAIRGANRTGVLLVATGLDGRVVRQGDTLAIVKAAHLWVDESALERTLAPIASVSALRVAPFQRRKAAFLAGQRIRPANFEAAQANLRATLAQFGVELVAQKYLLRDNPSEIDEAIQCSLAQGAELILIAGSILLDPEDPYVRAAQKLPAVSLETGAPIDPGTMFWVADNGQAILFGLASCELYGRLSILDLLLPYAIAKERIDRPLLAELGYGGLLEQTFLARRSVLDHPGDR